ncbi:MAG: molybdopterin oxidoreductase family protein [Syntrophobacteraceae bacterium]
MSDITKGKAVNTTCTLCGTGCSITLEHRNNQVVGVAPADRDCPVDQVSLCFKGLYGMDFINSSERLTTPLVRKDGVLVATTWNEALSFVAGRFAELKKSHGRHALGALGASSCTNEENYLLQKFVRTAFGCNNIDSGARIRTTTLMAGIERVLGMSAMTNPISHIREAYEILLIGADPSVAGPIIGRMVKQAVKLRGARLTLVDPLPNELEPFSGTRLRPRPGAYAIFLLGLLREIVLQIGVGTELRSYRSGWFRYLRPQLESLDKKKLEAESGVSGKQLAETAKRLLAAKRVAVIPGPGIATEENAYVSGVLMAALVLLTGNIWKTGCGLFPIAASLNDQGAMDMGTWPEKLPGHQYPFDASARVRFQHAWGVAPPPEKGLDYVSMIEAAAKGHLAGLYVVGENPVQDCPDKGAVRDALSRLQFLVVQDRFLTETAELAHVVLPSASFAEKEGTWTSMERRVQRIRQVLQPIGESRPDWAILTELMHRMRVQAPYTGPHDVLREINATVPIYGGITTEHLEQEELFWPCADPENPGTEILYAHVSSKGFVDDTLKISHLTSPELPAGYPFRLIVKESPLHSLDRAAAANSSTVRSHSPAFQTTMNPSDADSTGIEEGSPVQIDSRVGSVECRVSLDERTPRGLIVGTNNSSFAFHELFALADRDPMFGSPKLNPTAVKVEPVLVAPPL